MVFQAIAIRATVLTHITKKTKEGRERQTKKRPNQSREQSTALPIPTDPDPRIHRGPDEQKNSKQMNTYATIQNCASTTPIGLPIHQITSPLLA
ncbi:uncharacterized protein H6S33_012651 [Morchella sextelata]|uniref:uncharacterized protein n=1 Tax=Morchella sextelata TaxID=1174677 RepID=UPI001D04F30D|nr:uncharacterized protein H6S33_012651 [Morchella sextelata]KAH0610105.1 hypothetical protein H6S33_012651 [Morchella sextelata]